MAKKKKFFLLEQKLAINLTQKKRNFQFFHTLPVKK